MEAKILPAGETCLFVDFGEVIDLAVNGRVQALARELSERPFRGMKELVPTYRSLSVYFDPQSVDLPALRKRLEAELANPSAAERRERREVRVPVCFGGEFGPDLGEVAAHTGLTEEEVVKRYCDSPLYCYMNGFTPGFPYLGGMDPSLTTPRLKTPRELIPANSVAIGGAQAGAYSIASPGGWRIIGRVPYDLYDPRRDPAVAITSGLWVKFYPVGNERYAEIQTQIKSGEYRIEYAEREASA
ncbi:5-oxoprolinase subunit PxpB [Pyramidobacter sp. SM-530-WT-4B]|uniref:5-oxoprolinase subunit PxpB n=1 Tax=Pyramidobacter porci TaxID=2605789 RepID=A0A6L5YEI6_9BACT|nr:5-oxoprolinase subunit PxpB [Pyramidobacter porci]MST56629.1 5-oxoprolinase subunit PxpB [Pyramidobacter porci]